MAAASAVALTGVFAAANAQVVVELEGPLNSYVAADGFNGTMTVMNTKVVVSPDTAFVTPTKTRDELFASNARNSAGARYNVTNWIRGDSYYGRNPKGVLGATVIVTGVVDPATGVVTAQEVFTDVAENVVLGVVSETKCTNAECNNEGDFIRGNGPTGPVFIPNKDPRLPANAIVDAGLFELNLQGANLNGALFGGEGYFSQTPIHPVDAPAEQAVVYWAFELGDIRADLLKNKGIREISVLRIRCDVGDRLEVRGWVHQPVNAAGISTASAATGTIRAIMRFPGATDITVTNGAPVAEANNAYANYRLRGDVANCADEVEVQWLTGPGGAVLASTIAPVDRLRGDEADD
ncbi:hypothetical protein [Hyphomonas sp.]|uniref:hypothetical protein n=1 Tax=Hyphomonas sp. TaxID=87 RepID=UPI00391B4FAD